MFGARSKLDGLAMYGVPIIAGIVTAAVLLGPGRERPALGARIYAYGLDHALPAVALRVSLVAHRQTGHFPQSERLVTVAAWQAGHPIGSFEGHSDDAGLIEASIRLTSVDIEGYTSGKSPIEVRVLSHKRLLAAGVLSVVGPLASLKPLVRLSDGGPIEVSVVVPRGVLASPFYERVQVKARLRTPTQDELQLKFEVSGANTKPAIMESQSCDEVGCDATWQIAVQALAPTASLGLKVTASSGVSTTFNTPLPVVNGRIWLEPSPADTAERAQLQIVAPFTQDFVFVSAYGVHGRIWGKRVAMKRDDKGFSWATLPALELPADDSPLVVRLSSDLTEPLDTSALWPLYVPHGNLQVKEIPRIADGMPAAIAAEVERAARVRRPAWGVVLACGLFELLYLALRLRRADAELIERLRKSGIHHELHEALERRTPLWWLCLGVFGFILMFVMLAVVAAWA